MFEPERDFTNSFDELFDFDHDGKISDPKPSGCVRGIEFLTVLEDLEEDLDA